MTYELWEILNDGKSIRTKFLFSGIKEKHIALHLARRLAGGTYKTEFVANYGPNSCAYVGQTRTVTVAEKH